MSVYSIVLWVATQYSFVGGHQRFGGTCCSFFSIARTGLLTLLLSWGLMNTFLVICLSMPIPEPSQFNFECGGKILFETSVSSHKFT
jgi:hypothetical protein